MIKRFGRRWYGRPEESKLIWTKYENNPAKNFCLEKFKLQ